MRSSPWCRGGVDGVSECMPVRAVERLSVLLLVTWDGSRAWRYRPRTAVLRIRAADVCLNAR